MQEWMSGMYALNEKVNHILRRFLPFYQRPMAFSVSFMTVFIYINCMHNMLKIANIISILMTYFDLDEENIHDFSGCMKLLSHYIL